jgi:hypothetical protein
VDLPSRSKLLGHKCIFKRKMKVYGTIDNYKARLVIKEFRQQDGVEHFDAYLPISRIISIQTLIVIITINKLEIHQIDVKINLLNSDLDEEVYIEQPKGFVINGQEKKVYKLDKSLYGLK